MRIPGVWTKQEIKFESVYQSSWDLLYWIYRLWNLIKQSFPKALVRNIIYGGIYNGKTKIGNVQFLHLLFTKTGFCVSRNLWYPNMRGRNNIFVPSCPWFPSRISNIRVVEKGGGSMGKGWWVFGFGTESLGLRFVFSPREKIVNKIMTFLMD